VLGIEQLPVYQSLLGFVLSQGGGQGGLPLPIVPCVTPCLVSLMISGECGCACWRRAAALAGCGANGRSLKALQGWL